MTTIKICAKCGCEKEAIDFSTSKTSKDGLQPKCRDCVAAYYQANKEKIREKHKLYREENSDVISACQKRHYERNKESVLAKTKQHYRENPEFYKEYRKAYNVENRDEKLRSGREYDKKNREKISIYRKRWHEINGKAQYAKHRGRYIQAATERIYQLKRRSRPEEAAAIKEFYRNCPEGYHVDHIIPMKGKLVSGLHVLSNLQYLTPEENRRKGNKFEF